MTVCARLGGSECGRGLSHTHASPVATFLCRGFFHLPTSRRHGAGPDRGHPRHPLHGGGRLLRLVSAQQEVRRLLILRGQEAEAQSGLRRGHPSLQSAGTTSPSRAATQAENRASSSASGDRQTRGACRGS